MYLVHLHKNYFTESYYYVGYICEIIRFSKNHLFGVIVVCILIVFENGSYLLVGHAHVLYKSSSV